MAPITWKNVSTPSLTGALEAGAAADKQILGALDPLQTILTDTQKRNEANFANQTKQNTATLEARLRGTTDINQLDQDFNPELLQQELGATFDPIAINTLRDTQRTKIKSDNTAAFLTKVRGEFGVDGAPKSNEDVQSIIQGLDPSQLDVAGVSAALTKGFNLRQDDKVKADSDAYDLALNTGMAALTESGDPAKGLASIMNSDLDGAAKVKAVTSMQDVISAGSEMSDIEKAQERATVARENNVLTQKYATMETDIAKQEKSYQDKIGISTGTTDRAAKMREQGGLIAGMSAASLDADHNWLQDLFNIDVDIGEDVPVTLQAIQDSYTSIGAPLEAVEEAMLAAMEQNFGANLAIGDGSGLNTVEFKATLANLMQRFEDNRGLKASITTAKNVLTSTQSNDLSKSVSDAADRERKIMQRHFGNI